jgi:hypothetical protein
MRSMREPRDKRRGPGRIRAAGEQTRGETIKVKPKDDRACRTKNKKPRRI